MKMVAFCFAAAATALGGCASPELNFVHMADSQFGFYDYEAELGRYREAVGMINADVGGYHPAFMLMCGDMVNIPTAAHNADFLAASKPLDIPYYVVPGNHDLNANPETVKLYHDSFGPDYYTFDSGAYRFIVVNTNLWKYPQARTGAMDEWLVKAFEQAESDGKIIMVAGHSPLFLKTADEPEDKYYNLSPERRKWVLDLFRKYGVIAYFGGHSHTRIDNTWEGIRFLHSENVCTNFDNRPFGYRIVMVRGREVSDCFVPLDSTCRAE
ncbi:MAG: metallophosphoesterase [Victivallaceae bacterium]|nr:metallophosphoesterase [Victivallaceae bacterium]